MIYYTETILNAVLKRLETPSWRPMKLGNVLGTSGVFEHSKMFTTLPTSSCNYLN